MRLNETIVETGAGRGGPGWTGGANGRLRGQIGGQSPGGDVTRQLKGHKMRPEAYRRMKVVG
jgi:hypothetical protein